MSRPKDDPSLTSFLAAVNVGDVLTGTITAVERSGALVLLDDFPDAPIGVIGSLDFSWQFSDALAEVIGPGDRVRAEVIAVDFTQRRVRLSRSATEHPRLWAFLKELRPGQRLSGTVAAIERFGVFVALNEGPDHPVFPGVGFITMPELSWRCFQDPSEVISMGQYITCEVLAFDTSNGEARLSLRATQPDPFQQFADQAHVGQVVEGTVTQLVPFGAFVRLADGIEGLLHSTDDAATPGAAPRQAVEVGDHVSVTITAIDTQRRRVAVSRPRPHVRPGRQAPIQAPPGHAGS